MALQGDLAMPDKRIKNSRFLERFVAFCTKLIDEAELFVKSIPTKKCCKCKTKSSFPNFAEIFTTNQ
jgi:hypothetical protein